MTLTSEQVAGLNVALNEARFINVEVSLSRRAAVVELNVLSLTEDGTPLPNPNVELRLNPVGRAAASFLDERHSTRSLRVEELGECVSGFGGKAIYGWEFIDPPSSALAWLAGAGLDVQIGRTGLTHRLLLFQESAEKKLDLCLWFDGIEIYIAPSTRVPLQEFIAGGKRWWDGVFSGNPHTRAAGFEPLK